jgi:hypothetical protein
MWRRVPRSSAERTRCPTASKFDVVWWWIARVAAVLVLLLVAPVLF